MPFETNFGALTATIGTSISDPNGLIPDATIIRLADSWRLTVDWTLSGLLVGMLAGDWKVQAFLESFGPQSEILVVDETISLASGFVNPFSLVYHLDKDIAAGAVTEAGVYRLVTVITSVTPAGTPGPFAGYDEGPMLQFYAAP